MSVSAPRAPLQRDTFDAHRLMAEHPPVLHNPNKKIVFDVACQAGMMHKGEITGIEGAVEWHVNFADTRLFFGYGTGLLAQDEMQVAERPSLGCNKQPKALF